MLDPVEMKKEYITKNGNVVTLNTIAKVEDKGIWFFWLGKWRGVRYYQGKGIPSKKVMDEAIRTFIVNVGKFPEGTKVQVDYTWH